MLCRYLEKHKWWWHLLQSFYQLQLFVVDFTFTQHSVQHQDGKVQGLLAQPQVMLYLEYRGTGYPGTAAGDAVPIVQRYRVSWHSRRWFCTLSTEVQGILAQPQVMLKFWNQGSPYTPSLATLFYFHLLYPIPWIFVGIISPTWIFILAN